MYGFDAVFELLKWLAIVCVIFAPLGLWKLVEIIIWVTQHVKVV